MSGYERLANAIILKAVDDYRRALRKLGRFEDDINALSTVREVERFFRSKWFADLCNLDGEILIDRLKGECHDCKRISQPSPSA